MPDVGPSAHEDLNNVFWIRTEDGGKKLATINLTPGENVYGEDLISFENREFRIWNPYRSKLASAIMKQIKFLPMRTNDKILYLGVATGTTASHISDIVGKNGKIYCVEFSQRAMRELIGQVCSKRSNMYPILADARFPERYRIVTGFVDSIYCDIAQPEQARILVDNSNLYLKDGGGVMLAIKSRSIDVTESPKKIFKHEVKILQKNGFTINETIILEPFEKDHAMVTAIYSRK